MKPVLRLIFILFIALQFPLTATAALNCSDVFKDNLAPKSIHYYLKKVEAEQQNAATPTFLDPKVESQLVPRWQGTRDVPQAVRQTLLDTTAVINQSLMAADAGVVKLSEPGEFTSLRVNHQWQGKDMSTNLGITISSLTARAFEGTNKLVPSNAKAVLIFLHGGGTKTTGHHVAASIANFMSKFGIVVISIDSPYHGYGPRVQDLTPIQYYEYLRDFRHEFIPENVPTFIGGHSMGGLHADNIMRLSDNPQLKFKDAFAGLVNLSGPLDNAPGKPLREKNRVEQEFNENEALMEKVPEAERDLSVSLLLAGKTSSLSGVSTETFMGLVNWTKPSHGGRDYIPTLAVMGARDALYIGREDIFDAYINQLSNTTTKVMGQRTDYNGQDIWVSHMIFDHYRPGTKDLETFNVIKDFIDQTLGETLPAATNPLISHLPGSSVGVINKVIQSYYNNLAFRHFAGSYQLLVKKGTDQIKEMGAQTGQLGRELKQIAGQLKNLNKDRQANAQEIEALETRKNEIQAEMGELKSLQSSTWIPKDGPLKEYAEGNVARRKEINDQIMQNIGVKKGIVGELRSLRERRTQLENQSGRLVEKELELASVENAELAAARKTHEEVLNSMLDLQIKMNEMNSEMVTAKLEKGEYDISPTEAHLEVYRQLDQAYANYVKAETQLKRQIEIAIGRGELGAEAQQMILELWGSLEAYVAGNPLPESLIGKIEGIRNQIRQLELQNSSLQREANYMEKNYVERVTPELYTVEITTLARELERPLEDLLGHTGNVEKIWRDWTEIWKERPPEQASSLY